MISHGSRGVPDVSYNANPGTGYAIYDSIGSAAKPAGFRSAAPAPGRRNGPR